MTRAEYAAALELIGHYRGAVIHQANDRWRAECECGYVSATRTSAALAVEAVEHHRRKMLSESNRNGVSLRSSVAARL